MAPAGGDIWLLGPYGSREWEYVAPSATNRTMQARAMIPMDSKGVHRAIISGHYC